MFPFIGCAQPEPMWIETRDIEDIERHFEICAWEDRLVAHEKASGFWWATLDAWKDEDPREFWRECIESNLIGRAVSIRRGFEPKRNVSGARLNSHPREFDVLVAHDNGGLARVKGETRWRSFDSWEPKRIRKPLALAPSVWSPRFHLDFGRRALRDLAPELETEHLARLPVSARRVWEQGSNAPSIRLVAAAVAQGWAPDSHAPTTLPVFWTMALGHAAKGRPPASATPPPRWSLFRPKPEANPPTLALPVSLQQSDEVAFAGRVNLSGWLYSQRYQTRRPAQFKWSDNAVAIHIEFWPRFDSQHEQLEARLELRDWLSQFFPLADVEKWLQPS